MRKVCDCGANEKYAIERLGDLPVTLRPDRSAGWWSEGVV
jgi:hypothetical protein